MFLWNVAVNELDSHPDHNKGPHPRTLCHSPKTHPLHIDPSHTVEQTINPLISQHLSYSPNFALLPLFGPSYSSYCHYYLHTTDIAALDTTFNVFEYNDWAKNRTHYLPDAEQMRYLLCHGLFRCFTYGMSSKELYEQ